MVALLLLAEQQRSVLHPVLAVVHRLVQGLEEQHLELVLLLVILVPVLLGKNVGRRNMKDVLKDLKVHEGLTFVFVVEYLDQEQKHQECLGTL